MDPIREARRQWLAHGWTDAADGMAMMTSLVRVHQLVLERIDFVLRPYGLTFARFELLRLLAFTHSGSMTMTRLGSLLQVHPTSVTSAVDRLVAQGYAVRRRGMEDGRLVLAVITDDGRAIVEKATAGLNSDVFARPGVDTGQVAELSALLSALRSDAGDPVDTD